MTEPNVSKLRPPRPSWLRKTKRLFPHPLFAGCISLACLAIGVILAGVGINVPGGWPALFFSVLFFAGCFVTAAAMLTPRDEERPAKSSGVQKEKPTFAVLVLLIGVYSWMLMVVMPVLDLFFKNGPDPIKYFTTVGIAIASTAFMSLYGKRVVREHFGRRGGRNLELTGKQVCYVSFFLIFIGIYTTWLLA